MQFRIEMSATHEAARIHLPGRSLELRAWPRGGREFEVSIADPEAAASGVVAVGAADAREAVWRVARATVRAVAELTGSTAETVEETRRLDFSARTDRRI